MRSKGRDPGACRSQGPSTNAGVRMRSQADYADRLPIVPADRSSAELILHPAERRTLPVNHDPWVLPVGYSRRAPRFDKIELLLLGAKRRFANGCGRLALCAWKEKSWRA